MTLVVLAVVVATVLALAFRGSIAKFSRPTTHRIGLLVFAALAEATSLIAQHPSVYGGWLAAGAIALVVYARLNPGRPGLYLAAVGMALNAAVIFANWGMPVSLDAAERAGVPDSRIDLADDPLRLELDDETLLPWLGEAIPLALPLRPAVASPGDVLTAAGAAVVIFTGFTGRGRPQPTAKPRKGKRARGKNRSAEASAAETSAGRPTSDSDVVTVGAVAVGSVGAAGGGTAVAQVRSTAAEPLPDRDAPNQAADLPYSPGTDPDGSAVARFGGIHGADGATALEPPEPTVESTQELDGRDVAAPAGLRAGTTVQDTGEDAVGRAAHAAHAAPVADGELGAHPDVLGAGADADVLGAAADADELGPDAAADEPAVSDDDAPTPSAPVDPAAAAAIAARKAEKREKKQAKKQARREAAAAAAAAEPVDKGEPPAAWRI